jgi:hypothetical protein
MKSTTWQWASFLMRPPLGALGMVLDNAAPGLMAVAAATSPIACNISRRVMVIYSLSPSFRLENWVS